MTTPAVEDVLRAHIPLAGDPQIIIYQTDN